MIGCLPSRDAKPEQHLVAQMCAGARDWDPVIHLFLSYVIYCPFISNFIMYVHVTFFLSYDILYVVQLDLVNFKSLREEFC